MYVSHIYDINIFLSTSTVHPSLTQKRNVDFTQVHLCYFFKSFIRTQTIVLGA